MKSWITIVIALCLIITLITMTIYIHYYKESYECDNQTSFFCFVDWLCDAGTVNSLGLIVPPENMKCHLEGLYGVEDANCNQQNVRNNPCSSEESISGFNPILCENGTLVTVPTDDNPFSCYCSMGKNILTTYDGKNVDITSGGQYNVGSYACGSFSQLIEGICSGTTDTTEASVETPPPA